MRYFLLALMLVCGGVANAVVEGELKGWDLDENGNVIVWVRYTVDGVEVPAPRDSRGINHYRVFDGQETIAFRMAYTNVAGMTEAEIGAWIDNNIRQHCEALTQRKANAVENAKLNLAPFVGRKVTVDTTEIQVLPTKAFVVSTTGKVSEKALTPPEPQKDLLTEIAEIKASLAEVKTSTDAIAVK
jgi:hypothetical protein